MSLPGNSTPYSNNVLADNSMGLLHNTYDSIVFHNMVSVRLLPLILLISSLLAWRLWRFTIVPMLHPDLPKEFPHWIPSKLSKDDELRSDSSS